MSHVASAAALPSLLCPGCGHPGAAAGDFDVCVCPACRGAWVHDPAEAAAPAPRPVVVEAASDARDPGDGFDLVSTGPATFQLVRRARRGTMTG